MLNTVLVYRNVTERDNIPDREYVILAFDRLRATSRLLQ